MKQESGGPGSYKSAAQRRIDYIVASKNKSAQKHKSDAARVEGIKYKKRQASAGSSYTPKDSDSRSSSYTPKESNVQKTKDQAYSSAVRDRMKAGQHKGDYYGPDELKGNFSQIKKWRDAGKPPVQGWLNRQRDSQGR